ncbi:ATP-binding protein [Hymenobacter sp. UYCo722]|uniref:ATP-binding protein n=1 Tax=Hymenobacter sp. UYCo722 TaxID=3156335 RepID=UPI003393A462
MSEPQPTAAELARTNEELRAQLEEAQDLIHAIRTGAVDALAVQSPEGPRIFTLQGADQSYRALIEQMNEGALLLSETGLVLYCNACLAGLLGRPLAEVMGSAFEDFVPPTYRTYWAGLLHQSWLARSRGELPLQTAAGALVPFSVAMNVLEFNDTPALAVIVTDLSARREITAIRARVAEQNAQLDQQNEELKRKEAARRAGEQAAAEATRVLESIPQIAWTATSQGINSYLNRRWFDYIGQENAVGLDHGWTAHLHPLDYVASAQRWRECLATGEPYEVEYRFRNAAGDYRWMLGRALPSRNAQGEIIQWIGTCTDIHEQKLALERIDEAQRELRHNNEQLTRANVDLDNFIYTASHDLKAPISNIEGLLDVLRQELPAGLPESPEVQPVLGLMQESVNRFKRTIDHLTDVSKLQKEHGHPNEVVDLAAVIRDVQLDLEPLIRATQAQLEIDVQAVPTVSFSEKNLRSVVFNLLSNALKYHAPDRPPRVRLRAWPEADATVFEVQDNGLGLNAANEQRLFGMFQRFHDHVEGSGIGLYMVKKMVENVGGRITVQSELDQGSTFTVYFPAR